MYRILAILAVLLTTVAGAATFSIRLGANPDGSRATDYRCLDGVTGCKPPAVATLSCDDSAAPSLVGLPTGTAYSANVLGYFSGSASGSAVYSIETISGDNAVTAGWSLSGNNLVNAASATGSGVLRIRGYSTQYVACSSRSWSLVTPPAADTLAPPVPTGLEVTSVAASTVNIEFDSVCDNYRSEAASGTAQYNVRRSGVAVETFAASSCSNGALTQTIIGASDGTPSSTQTGNNWALSFGGAGTGGTTHNLLVRGASLAGNVTVSGTVTALASTADFEKAGVGIFAGSADDAPYCAVYYQGNGQAQMACRASTGASRSNRFTVSSITLPLYVKIVRSGDTFTGYYSSDGGAWTAGASLDVPMTGTVIAGAFITSNTAATNATATVENLNISTVGRVTRAVTTTSGGTWTVSADDAVNNESAFSAGASGTPEAPAANSFKWNPGTYINTGNYRCTAAKLADDYATITEISSMPNVKGVHIRTMWDCLEGATAGDYTAGFALIDEYLSRLAAAGNKRLILQVWPMGYGSCTTSNSSGGVYTGGVYLPAYIKNNASMMDYCYSNQRLWSARLWAPEVMDRLIALSAAYAARYNSNPLFEMWEPHEETIGMVGNASANFTWSAAETQWNRLYDAMETQWTNTVVHDPVNWMQNDTMIYNQLNRHTREGVIYGTTDTLLDATRRIPGQLVWRGLNSSDGSDNASWPSRVGERWVARAMWGPLYREQTITNTFDYAKNTMSATYFLVWKQTYYAGGGGATQWPAVKAFINAGSAALTNTACPSGWTCTTGGVP